MNISQGQVAKIIENMQKLKLQEMNTPDSIKYYGCTMKIYNISLMDGLSFQHFG